MPILQGRLISIRYDSIYKRLQSFMCMCQNASLFWNDKYEHIGWMFTSPLEPCAEYIFLFHLGPQLYDY